MRVLVTGGAGYIGSRTAHLLAVSGHDVTVFDDLSRGNRAAVDGLHLVKGDVRDLAQLVGVLDDERIEAVVHFAALKSVEEATTDPGAYFETNVGGTLALLQAMASSGVRQLVFSSSCAVYGSTARLPVGEDAPLGPANAYGESKLLAERLLPWFASAHGIRSAVLRYFNAAGATADGEAGEDWSLAPNLIPVVLGVAAGRHPALTVNGTDLPTPDGTAVRDYIHVLDLAAAHERALEVLAARTDSFTLNLGTGTGTSVAEVVDAARRITGRAIPVVDGPPRIGDPPAIWADTALAERLLGWRATLDLDAILRSAWAWHSRHPDGYPVAASA